jgi:hypothetical protein
MFVETQINSASSARSVLRSGRSSLSLIVHLQRRLPGRRDGIMAATAKGYDSPNILRADGEIGMRRFLNRLKVVVDSPLTQFLVGLGLVPIGATEIYGDMIDGPRRFHVGVHHDIVILGVTQVLSALPALVQGIERGCGRQKSPLPTSASGCGPEGHAG